MNTIRVDFDGKHWTHEFLADGHSLPEYNPRYFHTLDNCLESANKVSADYGAALIISGNVQEFLDKERHE
jgi:hypothetical protein